jgi:hypothetical protein
LKDKKMELLNHFVAARLMKDAQLFERIGRYDGTQKLIGKPRAFTNHEPKDAPPTEPLAQAAIRLPANDDAGMRHSG